MLKILSSSDLYVAPDQRHEFESLRKQLLRDLQPMNALQADQCNSLLRAHWEVRRCDLAECDLAAELGRDPLLSTDPRLRRIQRTREQAQRQIRLALKELQRLQTDFAIRRLQENVGLQALPVPVDTTRYIKAARAAAGRGPRERISFPPVAGALDQLVREKGLGDSAWDVWYNQQLHGDERSIATPS